jgi:hypothetical protein
MKNNEVGPELEYKAKFKLSFGPHVSRPDKESRSVIHWGSRDPGPKRP